MLKKGKLEGFQDWEYSPSSGGIKMGYTKYKGAMIVGSTLVLMEQNGDQNFWYRNPKGIAKRFTCRMRVTPLTRIHSIK